jgi:hypothetical protein
MYLSVGSGHATEIAEQKRKLCPCVAITEAPGRDFRFANDIRGKVYIAGSCR